MKLCLWFVSFSFMMKDSASMLRQLKLSFSSGHSKNFAQFINTLLLISTKICLNKGYLCRKYFGITAAPAPKWSPLLSSSSKRRLRPHTTNLQYPSLIKFESIPGRNPFFGGSDTDLIYFRFGCVFSEKYVSLNSDWTKDGEFFKINLR